MLLLLFVLLYLFLFFLFLLVNLPCVVVELLVEFVSVKKYAVSDVE